MDELDLVVVWVLLEEVVVLLVLAEVVVAELLLFVFFALSVVVVVAGLVGDRYSVLTHAEVPFEWLYAIFVKVPPFSNTSTASPCLSLPTTFEFVEGVYRTLTPDVAVQ